MFFGYGKISFEYGKISFELRKNLFQIWENLFQIKEKSLANMGKSQLKQFYGGNFSFPCSLNPSNIPSPTANWKVSLDLLTVVTEQTFFNQAS